MRIHKIGHTFTIEPLTSDEFEILRDAAERLVHVTIQTHPVAVINHGTLPAGFYPQEAK